jgi:hypothetical protein
MIVTDEYLDEVLARYDEARAKSWDEFFLKHFGCHGAGDSIRCRQGPTNQT